MEVFFVSKWICLSTNVSGQEQWLYTCICAFKHCVCMCIFMYLYAHIFDYSCVNLYTCVHVHRQIYLHLKHLMMQGLTLPYDNNLGQLLGTGAVMRFQGWRFAHWNEAVGWHPHLHSHLLLMAGTQMTASGAWLL